MAVAVLKNLAQAWQGRGHSDPPGVTADVQRYVIYGLYLAVWWIAVQRSHDTPTVVLAAGAVAILSGSGIALSAMWTLGRSYRERIDPGEDGVLQTTGVFGWMRHPMRVGLTVELIGTTVCSQEWVALVLTLGVGVLLVQRSREEEALLAARYGAAYAHYRETTPAIPM
ncbi:MAG: isoprenylcysteine carboxylmethyltransferase family protein, partial [Planctomycetota bacterium]|nr:isoprenylcysteine carboxylmethyltransferase family protein [Planctomycetota bacterium]